MTHLRFQLRLALPLVVVFLASIAARAGETAVYPLAGTSDAGAIGFGPLLTPDAGRTGVVHLGLRGDFFRGGSFPVTGTDTALHGQLSLAYGIAPGFELYGAYRNGSNANTAALPALVQAQGDGVLGAKYARELEGFQVGGDVRLDLKNGIGGNVWSLDASTFALRALGSWTGPVGEGELEVSANLGAVLGRSDDALDPRMTPALLFGTGLSGYDRFVAAVGARYRIGAFSPFAVLDLDLPLGLPTAAVSAGQCSTSEPCPGNELVSPFAAATKRVSLGLRVAAGAAGAFDFFASAAGGSGAPGFPATAPWAIGAAYAFAFDPALYGPPPPPPPPPPPMTGRLEGRIVDRATGRPLPAAVITLLGRDGFPVATDAQGRFLVPEALAGPVTVHVERAGYQPTSGPGRVDAGAVGHVELALDLLPPPPPPPPPPAPLPPPPPSGFLVGQLEGAGRLAGSVHLAGPRVLDTRFDEHGTFRVRLPPGAYAVTVLPEAHVARRLEVTVPSEDVALISTRLDARPAGEPVTFTEDRATPAHPLTLDEKRPDVADADLPVLLALADHLARNPLLKLTVLVHADAPKKGKDDRRAWTEARAAEIGKALLALGVAPEQLETKGMGLLSPLVPLGAKDQAKNRRIELLLSRLPAPQAPPVPAAAPVRPVAPARPASTAVKTIVPAELPRPDAPIIETHPASGTKPAAADPVIPDLELEP